MLVPTEPTELPASCQPLSLRVSSFLNSNSGLFCILKLSRVSRLYSSFFFVLFFVFYGFILSVKGFVLSVRTNLSHWLEFFLLELC